MRNGLHNGKASHRDVAALTHPNESRKSDIDEMCYVIAEARDHIRVDVRYSDMSERALARIKHLRLEHYLRRAALHHLLPVTRFVRRQFRRGGVMKFFEWLG